MRIAVTAAAVLWILITARPLLQPIAIGLLIWRILSASTHKIAQLLPARYRRGRLTVLFGVTGLLLNSLLDRPLSGREHRRDTPEPARL